MKILKKSISIILVVATLFSMFAISASAATSSAVAKNISAKLPIVTYANPISGASRVYSYSDSSLSKKTSGYYIDSFVDTIVITQISNNGKAVLVTYPGKNCFRSRWFRADDILGLSTVSISSGSNAAQKYNCYRMKSASSVSSAGSVSAGDSFVVLGTHRLGNGKTYYPTIYPVSRQTVNGVKNIRFKLAMTSSKVVSKSVPTPTPKPAVSNSLTNALYGINISGSKLTCGFDGYVRLRQEKGYRHEGIDFAYGSGRSIYSLTDGVIVNVVEGSSGKLSTVAIYYPAANKTIVYLHLDPSISAASKGSTISRGAKIGTEAARGADGAVHTHVEVRNGRTSCAAVSKDSVLVNSNPTSFWNSIGYTVK